MTRVFALLLLVTSAHGCAMGGASDELEAPPPRDAITLGDGADDPPADDAADPEASPADDVAAPEDTFVPTEDAPAPPPDAGCVPSCVTCGASNGCGGKCATGACPTGGTCVAGVCKSTATPTRSYLSPGNYAFGSGWARAITWTIGSEAPATIRYTLDGSTPGPTSPSKPSPADLFLPTSGTTLKWYADNGAKEPTVHSFVAAIDAAGQGKYGFLLERIDLSSRGPVVVVSPGAAVSGTVKYATWVSSGCPLCGLQLVYGVGTTSAGCVYHGSPGTWPGASGTGVLNVKAPAAPGTYALNMSYTLQLSCADGMATNPLGVRPTAQIATIVVK